VRNIQYVTVTLERTALVTDLEVLGGARARVAEDSVRGFQRAYALAVAHALNLTQVRLVGASSVDRLSTDARVSAPVVGVRHLDRSADGARERLLIVLTDERSLRVYSKNKTRQNLHSPRSQTHDRWDSTSTSITRLQHETRRVFRMGTTIQTTHGMTAHLNCRKITIKQRSMYVCNNI